MGQIRKQVLQSSFLSYIGFAIGAFNTYLFTKQGIFTPEQYGLTQVIISMSQILAPLAALGMTSFIGRFFPYYFSRLNPDKNDLLAIAFIVCSIGAILIFSGCLVFEPLVVKKFKTKSPLVVDFYYWTLVFSFFYVYFTILESYLGTLKQTVLPNFMKETAYRLSVTALIVLYIFQVISFSTFVILFCCIYFLIVCIIVGYLLVSRQLYLTFRFSKVTRRFRKRIVLFTGYVYSGTVISNLARQIDTISLAGARDLSTAGIYSLNQFAAAILQVPYRGLQSIAGPLIAEHWKDKNYTEINRIYQRSSINLLLIGCFLFASIWINYDDGLRFLNLETKYASGKTVFLLLGLYNIFELGTGANAVLLASSPAWRFEFFSGIILLTLSVPFNIIMARTMGMEGVAIATASTLVLYNLMRLIFIKYRFNMWPFTQKTLLTILLVTVCYLITWFLFRDVHGLTGILLRSVVLTVCFFLGVFYLKLTPDLPQFIAVVKQRFSKK